MDDVVSLNLEKSSSIFIGPRILMVLAMQPIIILLSLIVKNRPLSTFSSMIFYFFNFFIFYTCVTLDRTRTFIQQQFNIMNIYRKIFPYTTILSSPINYILFTYFTRCFFIACNASIRLPTLNDICESK